MKKIFFCLFAAGTAAMTGCDEINGLLGGDAPEDIRVQSELKFELDSEAAVLPLNAIASAPFSCKVAEGSAWLSLHSEPSAENADGRTPDAKQSGENPANVTYTLAKRIVVTENSTGKTRTGKIIVYRDSELAAITVTVTQWGEGLRPAYLNVTCDDALDFNANAGSLKFLVETNVSDYDIGVEPQDARSWLSCEPTYYDDERSGSTEIAPNYYKISVTANTGDAPREGRIEISGGGWKKIIAITQAAPGENGGGVEVEGKFLSFVGVPDGGEALPMPHMKIEGAGGNVEFTVYTNLEAYEPYNKEWPGWLSTPRKIRSDKFDNRIEDTYTMTVEANDSGSERSAEISFHGWDRDSGRELVATMVLYQQ